MYTWSFTFHKKYQKVKTDGKNIMSKKILQLKQSSNFYLISEVEICSMMPVGYVLYYSDESFLPDFLHRHYWDALHQNIYQLLIAYFPKPQSMTNDGIHQAPGLSFLDGHWI